MIFNSLGLVPYESQHLRNSFIFKTDTGAIYEIYFTDGSSYFSEAQGFAPYVAMFGFRPTSAGTEKKGDARIAVTIAKHICDYLEDERNMLMYVCDQHDRREEQRARLFNQWFLKFQLGEKIQKIDLSFGDLLVSFMFRYDNPFRYEIEASMPDVREKYN